MVDLHNSTFPTFSICSSVPLYDTDFASLFLQVVQGRDPDLDLKEPIGMHDGASASASVPEAAQLTTTTTMTGKSDE